MSFVNSANSEQAHIGPPDPPPPCPVCGRDPDHSHDTATIYRKLEMLNEAVKFHQQFEWKQHQENKRLRTVLDECRVLAECDYPKDAVKDIAKRTRRALEASS